MYVCALCFGCVGEGAFLLGVGWVRVLCLCIWQVHVSLCTSVLMESLHFQVDPVLITGIAPDGCLLSTYRGVCRISQGGGQL